MLEFISSQSLFSIISSLVSVLNILFALIVIFFERKSPETTVTWLIVVLVFPIIGFLFYMVFALEPTKLSTFQMKDEKDKLLQEDYINMERNESLIKEQIKLITQKNIIGQPGTEKLNDLIYLNFVGGTGILTADNEVDIYHDGNKCFDQLFKDIENAKNYIHIQSYIVRNDNLGKKMVAALAKKAEEGLEVKYFIDGMGCWNTPKRLFQPLIDAGGQVGVFLPPHFIRLNYRNHRKIYVIDGEIGYVGGLNIGDEYLGKVERYGHWRDAHIRIVGSGVHTLEVRFMMDWNAYAKEDEVMEVSEKYFPEFEDKEGVLMQMVSSGPDTDWQAVRNGYVKMINEADSHIYIQTPYYIPDDLIQESLKIAALSGIDVRLMIPANPDHPFVYWAALSYIGELIDAGVKCYQYNNGFLHSKVMIIDSLVTSVGTANFDVRSFRLNFEINAFIYDSDVAEVFEREFMVDMSQSTEIDHEFYNNRSLLTRIKEAISRLLSPIL